MTDHDRRLIEQARLIHYTEWYQILDLVAEAETSQAKTILSDMAKKQQHIEEFNSGLL